MPDKTIYFPCRPETFDGMTQYPVTLPAKKANVKRSIYGLKQSPRTWSTTLGKKLAALGFTTAVHPNPVPPYGPLMIATRHEGDAAVAEISEAEGVPGRLGVRRLALDQPGNVARRGRHHGFDHEAGLGHPNGHGRLADDR